MPARRFSLLLLAWFALVTPTLAQTRDTTRLGEIVVTATRSPTPLRALGSSADLLSPAELAKRQVSSLRDALQLLPGGAVFTNGGPGGVTSLFLRGVSSSQTLLLVDGIRVNDANTSYGSFLGGSELSGTSRVEVVRGPQSTLYGGAAIGGVVSFDAAPGTGPARGEARIEAGSFGTWAGRVFGSGGASGTGLSLAFTANGTDNQRHPNGWDQRTQLIRLDQRLSGTFRAGASFRGLQQTYNSPGDLRTSNTTPAGTTTFENNLGTVWLEAVPVSAWRSKLVAGGQQQFTKGTSRFNGGPESAFTLSNSRRVVDWQNTITLRREVTLVAGANREWSTVTSGGQSMDERLLGLYAEAELTPVDPLTFTAGVRNDDYTTFGAATTWRLTAAWRVQPGTKLRGSVGTGFMPPSLAARYGSAFQNPNPDIRPERSRGWDAGVDREFLSGRGTLSATWFHNSLRDLIGFEGADFPAKGRNVNVDRARTSGLEVGGRLQAGPVDARLGWTLLSARSLSESDPALARLIRRPRQVLSGDVAVSVGRRGSIGGGVAAVASREDTDFNSFPAVRVNPGDYALARLYGSYDLTRRLSLRARADNLFDTRYEPVYGFPGLGRSFTLSLGAGF